MNQRAVRRRKPQPPQLAGTRPPNGCTSKGLRGPVDQPTAEDLQPDGAVGVPKAQGRKTPHRPDRNAQFLA
ncbi:MAG: hypothetical protein HYZ92_06420, partial [Candidatus Omnitrophica bacterium]|nr:hypothetical protein [Candidatus Omnitrophota bacterium]